VFFVGAKSRGCLTNQPGNFALVEKAGVAKQIITNTLHTMEAARQLEYLRESDLIDDTWKVVIQNHYYRERDLSMTAFHKDTREQTLFVNLSFVSGDPAKKEQLLDPEYVVNPPTSKECEGWVQKSGKLPATFVADLKSVKDSMGKPKVIEATRVPAKGFVAFVDEMIHHKTPTVAIAPYPSSGSARFCAPARIRPTLPARRTPSSNTKIRGLRKQGVC
jgi:hypothetical protein